MPDITLIEIGRQFPMVQNRVYASPIRRCLGIVNPAAASGLESSMTTDGTFAAVTVAADGSFQSYGAFVRSTAAGTSVLFRI